MCRGASSIEIGPMLIVVSSPLIDLRLLPLAIKVSQKISHLCFCHNKWKEVRSKPGSWAVNLTVTEITETYSNITVQMYCWATFELEETRFKSGIVRRTSIHDFDLCTRITNRAARRLFLSSYSRLIVNWLQLVTYKLFIKSNGSVFGSAWGVAQHLLSCTVAVFTWSRRNTRALINPSWKCFYILRHRCPAQGCCSR